MARADYLFTTESVSEGHPVTVCDRVSDEVADLFFCESAEAGLDAPQIRVCGTLATTNRVVIAGEVQSPEIDPQEIEKGVHSSIKGISYDICGLSMALDSDLGTLPIVAFPSRLEASYDGVTGDGFPWWILERE